MLALRRRGIFRRRNPKIRERSPAAVWTEKPDAFLAWSLSRKLGDGPFVLKDHIKSAKHLWHEATFVPKGSGRENFERIAENLKEEQGDTFHRGFVVKQYVPLRSRGESPREYPMCEEYRLFFWKRQFLVASHYHRLFHRGSGYRGTPGELWYVRLCPPLLDLVDYHVAVTTPTS